MFSGPEFNFIGHRMKAFYYVTDAFEVPETSEIRKSSGVGDIPERLKAACEYGLDSPD